MADPISFGQWLKRRRKTLDLTQDEFARRVGCSIATIQKIETDQRRPSKETAARLAQHLALPPAEQVTFVKAARAELSVERLGPAAPRRTAAADQPPVTPLASTAHPASDSRRTNLPRPRERLIGRDREVAAVVARLTRPEVGLVTLTGPGGVGKTRLGLQVATEVRDAFPDGVWFVALAALSDPTRVAVTIATVLGVQPVGDQPLRDRLLTYLREKQLLLVLDNFEQVGAAAPLLADLLCAAPAVTLLVTSRVVLGVYGEHAILVPPLALPDPACLPPLDELAHLAAVELFTVRAQAASVAFALTEQNAHAVVEICRRLDGLPLALELAASRVRLLPPQTLLHRLGSRLQLLTGGPRTLTVRQQTLRATIAWSYELLDAADQVMFRRLGVFAGGWTLEAAELVCSAGSDAVLDVLDGLQSLLDKSLVQQVEEPDGTARFRMLETIREYALERLAASGEADVLHAAHVGVFLALAETAAPALHGPQAGVWFRRLEVEHDNVRAALAASRLAPRGAELELRLAVALAPFWSERDLSLGRRALDGALERGREAPAGLRAQALAQAGDMARQQSDYSVASARLRESLGLVRHIGDPAKVADALVEVAMTALMQGDLEAARAASEEGLAMRQAVGEPRGLAGAYLLVGFIKMHAAQYTDATAALETALRLAQTAGNRDIVEMALENLGIVAGRRGDYGGATALLEQARVLAEERGIDTDVGLVWRELGMLAHAHGDDGTARRLLEQSLVRGRDLGQKRQIALSLAYLAGVDAAQGRPERAARVLGAAERLRDGIGAPLLPMDSAWYEGALAATRAQLDAATFAAAWTAGRAMALEQAITYALNDGSHSS